MILIVTSDSLWSLWDGIQDAADCQQARLNNDNQQPEPPFIRNKTTIKNSDILKRHLPFTLSFHVSSLLNNYVSRCR